MNRFLNKNDLAQLASFRGSRKSFAFSLVEVTIAIGIISFGLVAIVGLMPVGLVTMRQAMDQTIEAQISQQMAGEASLMPFSQLKEYVEKGPYFYTAEGIRQTVRNDRTRYEVKLEQVKTVFPGSENALDLSSNMTTFVVQTVRGSGKAVMGRSTNIICIPNSGS